MVTWYNGFTVGKGLPNKILWYHVMYRTYC